jgi:hypothetical protein
VFTIGNNGKKITLNGIVIGLIPQLAHLLENWVKFMINLRNLIPDGTMFFHRASKVPGSIVKPV